MENKKDNKDFCVCRLHSGVTVEIKSMQDAIRLARKELDRRLDGMNEFRDQLRNQAATFVTREISDVQHKRLEDRLSSLEKQKSNLEGRMWIIPSIIVLIQLGVLIFKIL